MIEISRIAPPRRPGAHGVSARFGGREKSRSVSLRGSAMKPMPLGSYAVCLAMKKPGTLLEKVPGIAATHKKSGNLLEKVPVMALSIKNPGNHTMVSGIACPAVVP
ncbi:hypothetical protein [Alistipes sp.]|uniref:hypothetical protein n=1 Tax=Alistipes sp. TaxID=1872444 RepID=UPI003AF101C8